MAFANEVDEAPPERTASSTVRDRWLLLGQAMALGEKYDDERIGATTEEIRRYRGRDIIVARY
jgi:hypothetical protein